MSAEEAQELWQHITRARRLAAAGDALGAERHTDAARKLIAQHAPDWRSTP